MSRLGPGDMPRNEPVRVIHGDDGGLHYDDDDQMPVPLGVMQKIMEGLAKLRAPFPPDQIEKLPKPIRKGAWDGRKGGHCNICHGYHVLEDAIHLDYVGHANTTNRLLEVDPFWEWEPLAYTEAGLPLFDKVGGLWIRLTVCGVTRLGYGDGKEPKEIIGDAIRNAAMRFGVALDLWSKIDLHAERNPGDGETQTRRPTRQGDEVHRGGSGDPQPSERDASDEAPNQDALDALGSVCDENGYDRRTMRNEYAKWAAKKRYKDQELLTADSDRIIAFAAKLIEDATPDAAGDAGELAADRGDADIQAGQVGGSDGSKSEHGQGGAVEDAGDEAQALDTSDVEKQPGDIF